jgi:hypothetical protein
MGKKYIKIPEVLSSWLIRFQVFSARAKKNPNQVSKSFK